MSTRKGATLSRSVAAVGIVVAASIGVSGCAAIPNSNDNAGAKTSVSTNKLDLAVANAPSKSQIARWYRAVGPEINAVERSVDAAQHAVRRPGHYGLHKACSVLRSRVERVRSARPNPDQVARHAISREMADLDAAGRSCMNGELLAAGHSANLAHYWSRIADARILHVLRHES